MRCTKDTCMFCVFVCGHLSPKYKSLYQHEKKPILGLFSSMNMHKLQVVFVKVYYIITKITCKLVILLVIFVNLHFITCNFCRRFHCA